MDVIDYVFEFHVFYIIQQFDVVNFYRQDISIIQEKRIKIEQDIYSKFLLIFSIREKNSSKIEVISPSALNQLVLLCILTICGIL